MHYIPVPALDVCLLSLSSEDSLAQDVILEYSSNSSIVTFITIAPLPSSIQLGTSKTTTSPNSSAGAWILSQFPLSKRFLSVIFLNICQLLLYIHDKMTVYGIIQSHVLCLSTERILFSQLLLLTFMEQSKASLPQEGKLENHSTVGVVTTQICKISWNRI